MPLNPYSSDAALANQPVRLQRLRDWRWWLGVVLLCTAAICLVMTVEGMRWAFSSLNDTSVPVDPARLASRINMALFPVVLGVPSGLLGLILMATAKWRSVPKSEPPE